VRSRWWLWEATDLLWITVGLLWITWRNRTLQRQQVAALVALHDQQQPLGIAKISDSKSGLLVEGSMLMTDPNAQRVNAFMKMGSVKGLSIGFASPDPAKTSYDDDGNRKLREIKLYEWSICPIPANPLAVVTSVKSLAQVEQSCRPFG
jgi:HK97 family phage prohead protease